MADDKSQKAKSKSQKKEALAISSKLAKIIEEIEKLTVVELNDLVKALEAKLGITAAMPAAAFAAPAAPDAAPAAAGSEGAPQATQATFNVVLTSAGANKISVIKMVREINQNLGLKEAKDLVESAPKPVLEGANKESAQEAKKKLEEAGASVELK